MGGGTRVKRATLNGRDLIPPAFEAGTTSWIANRPPFATLANASLFPGWEKATSDPLPAGDVHAPLPAFNSRPGRQRLPGKFLPYGVPIFAGVSSFRQ
jgi:hypothetical protein